MTSPRVRYHAHWYTGAEIDSISWIIEQCIDAILASGTINPSAIILTGSYARSEGSLLMHDGRLISLSDMEFLVVVSDRDNPRDLKTKLQALETRLETEHSSAGILCKVEFTPALERYFENADPSIFACELKAHGKTVWGNDRYLALIPAFSPDQIPKLDAFYLLCNRLIEQMAVYGEITTSNADTVSWTFRYSMIKMYIDLATSLLIFAGGYATTYQERCSRIIDIPLLENLGIPDASKLRQKIVEATDSKLHPDISLLEPTATVEAMSLWRELAVAVHAVWEKEVVRLAGEEYLVSFPRLGSKVSLVRYWGKLAYMALLHGRFGDLLRFRYSFNNPRHLLYLVAADCYFSAAGITGWKPVDRSSCYPLRLDESKLNSDLLHNHWTLYFRNC